MHEFNTFRDHDLAKTPDMAELRAYYLQRVPDAYDEGWDRLHEGQGLNLCPENLIDYVEPAAIIPMLTSVIEPIPMVLHSLRAIENEARAAGAPFDLFLWCNWELPDRMYTAKKTLEEYHSLTHLTLEEQDRVNLVWEKEVAADYATNHALYTNLIEAIRAANIDPDFLRIRPTFVWEDYKTPLTNKVRHCYEAILENAEHLDRSPDIPIIRLDADTTFFRPKTLQKQIEVTRQNITPMTKAWMVFTRELHAGPDPIPLSQRDVSERIGSIYSLAQRMAEEKVYHHGGSLPYLDEVGTAMTLRTFARILGTQCHAPDAFGESRAMLCNIQDKLHIPEKAAVTFLPDTRLGTSNRKIVRDIHAQLASANQDRLYPLVFKHSSGDDYRSYAESMELWRHATFRPGFDNIPFSPKEIFHMVNGIEYIHRIELDGLQLLRIARAMGKLGLDQLVHKP